MQVQLLFQFHDNLFYFVFILNTSKDRDGKVWKNIFIIAIVGFLIF